MTKLKFQTLALLGILLLPSICVAEAVGLKWQTHYKAAIGEAQQKNVPLVLNFTGSDWCVWCQKLDAELFSGLENPPAVFVEVDFPRNSRQPVKLSRTNRVLKSRFDVESFPTVIWLNPFTEEILFSHGYSQIESQDYADALRLAGVRL